MKLLIVDDSSLIRERVIAILKETEKVSKIYQAQNALEARALIDNYSPDLIILDISMPGGSGMELLKSIRDEGSDVGIIILTNYPNQVYREKAIEYGANNFLSKIDEFEKLPEVVNKVFSDLDNSQD